MDSVGYISMHMSIKCIGVHIYTRVIYIHVYIYIYILLYIYTCIYIHMYIYNNNNFHEFGRVGDTRVTGGLVWC